MSKAVSYSEKPKTKLEFFKIGDAELTIEPIVITGSNTPFDPVVNKGTLLLNFWTSKLEDPEELEIILTQSEALKLAKTLLEYVEPEI